MTMREEYAKAAMQAFLSQFHLEGGNITWPTQPEIDEIALVSFKVAAAMISESEKPKR